MERKKPVCLYFFFFFGAFYANFSHINLFVLQPNAQEKFMRIKHAYNTLLSSDSRRKYDSGSRGSDFSYSTSQRSKVSQEEEEFYGLGKSLYCHTQIQSISSVAVPFPYRF